MFVSQSRSRPTRGKKHAAEHELIVSNAPPSHLLKRRPERHRRRHDQKVPFLYNRALSLVNRTYGRYDEYAEVVDAYNNNPNDPIGFLTAVGLNQATDAIYGKRAEILKKQVYNQSWYQLPIGLDAVQSLWQTL